MNLDWHGAKADMLKINSISKGDLLLYSEILDEGRGIVETSCDGKITGNMFFGKAGVGKSTIASLVSSKPGLFDSGTTESGTTTLGTWISRLSDIEIIF